MTTPKHEYETVEGTEPTTHGAHQPRTVRHTSRRDTDSDVSMMTEIGDGVFVAWSNCRKCNKQVYDCACADGPVEPEYMKKWRDARFKRDLDTRPDPSYDLLPSILEWVEERGYKITKKREKKELEEGQTWTQTVQPGEPFTLEGPVEYADPQDESLHDAAQEQSDYLTPGERRELAEWDKALEDHLCDEECGDDSHPKDAHLAEEVDTGLDEALAQVRAIKAAAIEVDF